jgi:ribonuclease Z
MNIDFLGRWSSNSVKGERTASIVIDDDLLIECGPHTVEAMLDLNHDPMAIKTVAITHMHLDHYVGLAELLWYRAIYGSRETLIITGPRGIKNNTEHLLQEVRTPEAFEINTLFYEDRPVDTIVPFRANHLIDDNGYRYEKGGKTLFYSGDTAYSENVVKGAEKADYLFHEMTYTDDKEKDATFWKHSTYSDVMRVVKESKAKRLVPVHLTTGTLALVNSLAYNHKNLIVPSGRIIL